MVSQVDIMATVSGLFGIKLQAGIAPDSQDFSANLLNVNHKPHRDHLIYHAPNNKYAIRKGDWVLVEHSTAQVSREPKWYKEYLGVTPTQSDLVLYNIKRDVEEKVNLLDKNPEIAASLLQQLNQIRSGS